MDLEFEDSPKESGKQSTLPEGIKAPPKIKVHDPEAGRSWKFARVSARLGIVLGLVLYLAGTFWFDRFDQKIRMSPELEIDPVQEPNETAPFLFEYGKREYIIAPLADYQISGLIVSHNNISSITDAYHNSDSVDFRDLCLVWGTNVSSGIFRKVTFWSEPWSCHYKFVDRELSKQFNDLELSNNHLLSDSSEVRETIRSMRIGDQVRLSGRLISYADRQHPSWQRKSSLTRDDQGDGACEVLWVERAEILQRAEAHWHLASSIGFWLLVLSGGSSVALFLLTPLRFYRRFR